MLLLETTDAEARAIVGALHAVASGGGAAAALPIELDCIGAIQRHLMQRDPPLPGSPGPLPATLERDLADPSLRKRVVRVMAMLACADIALPLAKIEVMEEAARRLGIAEFGLALLGRVARGTAPRFDMTLLKRFLAHYWSFEGRAGRKEWLSLLWSIAPWIPGLGRAIGQPELLARYRSLAALPEDSFGHAVHRYYAVNGFPVPGAPKSIPEGWARHEVYHVLSGYNINLPGELLLAGFIAGNTEEMCLDLALPALLQIHANRKFVPGPTAEGLLRPDAFFHAVARGSRMRPDLLAGWRLWDDAPRRLEEVRARFGIPPIPPERLPELEREEALLAI